MPEVWPRPEVFDRGTPVFAYWLTHAEGLDVEPLGGVVQKVLVPAPLEPPTSLVLRFPGSGRTKTISADIVTGIDPEHGRLLVVGGRQPRAIEAIAVAAWTAAQVVVATTKALVTFAKPYAAATYRRVRAELLPATSEK